jgi:hypothetical protein
MIFRSEPLRRYVASMACVHCGSLNVQAAHRNFGKGLGLKVSDGLIAALCVREHTRIDQGKDLSRAERRELMDTYIVRTFKRAEMRGDLDADLLAAWRGELEKAGMLEVA